MLDINTLLTPDELDITQEELDAFVKVHDYLASTELPLAPGAMPKDVPLQDGMDTLIGFSMNYECRPVHSTYRKFECGAVACIGGHISLVLQGVDVLAGGMIHVTRAQADEAITYTDTARGDLHDLFFPSGAVADGKWGDVRASTAAIALRNFLTTGEANWVGALREGGQDDLLAMLAILNDE